MNEEGKIGIFLKGSITFFCAAIGDKLEMISPIMFLLIILMAADYVSGMLASKKVWNTLMM